MKSPKDWTLEEWYSVLSQRNELDQQLLAAHSKIESLESKLSKTPNHRPIQFEHRKWTPYNPETKEPSKHETITLTGIFHQFSTEGDGQDIGPVAIIETPDGQIHTPSAHKCKFLNNP